MFTAAMFIFFSVIFLNMYKPITTCYLYRQAGPSGLAFYGSGPGCLLSWLVMANAGSLSSMRSEIFLHMKFTIFRGCSTKQVAFLPGNPVPQNQLIIELQLHKMSNVGFYNFKSTFLRISFHWLQYIFCLVLVICLSRYLHLKLSHEFLTFISFNIQG